MSTVNIYSKNTKIWIPHPEKVWESAIILDVVKTDELQLVIKTEDSNVIKSLIIKSDMELPPLCHPQDDAFDEISDLNQLTIIHEASVLHILRSRFEKQYIYSYYGTCMIILNTYSRKTNKINNEILSYCNRINDRIVPHVFGVAEKVFRRLEREKSDQSIIFSGESGSGKTFYAKRVISYLATLGAKGSQVKDKILASSIVLEAFGNANTVKSFNSSRFGKFLQLQCDTNYSIVGATLRTFLLDTSRLVVQVEREKNFNIFYQLYSVRERFPHLQLDMSEFNYLNRSIFANNINNVKHFNQTINAMEVLGFSVTQQHEIWQILAAILYLGNIEFRKFTLDANNTAESCFIRDLDYLEISMELFGINVREMKTMRKWMCYKRIIFQKNEILQPMSVEEATKTRDALAKFIYLKIFNWISIRINASIRSPCVVQSFIGILEIYGFEKLNANSLEQLCINYANEKVEQHFNLSVFKSQQKKYLNEEIKWVSVDYNDNSACLELIEGKNGIIDVMNQETKLTTYSNIHLIENLKLKCQNSKNFVAVENSISDFIICHFFGNVKYNTDEFKEKNSTANLRELMGVFKETDNELLNKLLLQEFIKLAPSTKKRVSISKRISINNKAAKKTVMSDFRYSLSTLMSILYKTMPYYVRCIKTNEENKPFKLNHTHVVEQLRAFNVVKTIQISAMGFFSQFTYANFFQRYHCLCSFEYIKSDNLQKVCKIILQSFIKDPTHFKLGKSKVLLKESAVDHLEQLRSNKRIAACVTLQRALRRLLESKRHWSMLRAVLVLQRHARSYLSQRRTLRNQAATQIQAQVRGWLERRRREPPRPLDAELELLRLAATRIQRHVRGFLARRRRDKRIKNVILVQACARRFLAQIAVDRLRRQRDPKTDNQLTLSVKLHGRRTLVGSKITNVENTEKPSDEIFLEKIQLLKQIKHKVQKLPTFSMDKKKKSSVYDINASIDENNMFEKLKPSYQKLFECFRNFDERANALKKVLNISDSEINEIKISREALNIKKIELDSENIEKNEETENDVPHDKNSYDGMLQFDPMEANTIIHHLVLEINYFAMDEILFNLPAQIIFMCIRYLDHVNNVDIASSTVEAYTIMAKSIIKHRKHFETTIMWLVNTHQLLNFLKQYSKLNVTATEQFHVYNTPRQNEQSLRNFDLEAERNMLQEIGQWMARKAIKHMKKSVLELAVPAFLAVQENEELNDNFLDAEMEYEGRMEKLSLLIEKFTNFYDSLEKFQVDRKIVVQMFKELFEFLSSLALSSFMSQEKLFTTLHGVLIMCNIRRIEKWAFNRRIFLAIEGLRSITQAVRLLQCQPISFNDVNDIFNKYNKLNYHQVIKILTNFKHEAEYEEPIPPLALEKIKANFLMKQNELEDTILLDTENNPINFPFHYSTVFFEEVEIPKAFNLLMVKKI